MTELEIVKEILIDYFVGQKELVDGILEQLKPTELKDQIQYDLEKIKWTEETGPKGDYQKAIEQESEHFRALINDLEAHEGKVQRNGFFLWQFSNTKTVGRKKAKQ